VNASSDLAGIYVAGLDPAPLPPKPPTWLEKIANKIFNLARRPLALARTREVTKIAQRLSADALGSLIASLEASGSCPICRFNAMNLRAAQFTSQIHKIVTIGKCGHHPGHYIEFESRNRADFDRSEKLSRWINGF